MRDYEACLQQSAVRAEAVEPSALVDTFNTLSEARDLAWRVMGLVDRIVGAAPAEGSAAGKGAEPTAVFDILRADSRRTVWSVRDAQEALNRLERALP